MSVTKGDLVEQIAKAAELTKKAAGEALDAVLETITASLKVGEKVTLTGFGTFSVTHRAARKGVNPQTGAPIQIAATKGVSFKAGKGLKDTVKGK